MLKRGRGNGMRDLKRFILLSFFPSPSWIYVAMDTPRNVGMHSYKNTGCRLYLMARYS